MWHDKNTFQALLRNEERIPTNILASRLKKLVALGLVEKAAYQERPTRYRYSLSDAGKSLELVLQAMMDWGHQKLSGGFYDPKAAENRKRR